jgi:hypothetical protein
MKRIIAAVAVVAIVSSALAFIKPYNTSFCASTTQNSGCTVVNRKVEVSGDTNFYKDPNWSTGGTCSSTVCGTATRLIAD